MGMLKLHEAKRCSSKALQNTEINMDDSNFESLRNVSYDESLNDANLISADREVVYIMHVIYILY